LDIDPQSNPDSRKVHEMKKPLRLSLVALLAVLALVAAACGTGDDRSASAAPVGGSEEPAVLPPNSKPDTTPPLAGACLEGEPECNDTAAPGDVPSDLPPPDVPDTPLSPTGVLVDGGLTVAEALATDATGVIAVKGFLLVDDQGARLCELLAESLPPQCGGSAIAITGYEEMLSTPLSNAQGVTWTDQYASFLGEIVDGVLVVDPTVAP
jgi:hypothetical protein